MLGLRIERKGSTMAKKSAVGKTVRYSADTLPVAAPKDLAALLAVMDAAVDASEVAEIKGPPVRRTADGRLDKGRKSPIRSAILAELGRRKMTRYQLWQKARVFCLTLPQSAVYEYLRGHREIQLPYAEAMMKAMGLGVGRTQKPVLSAPRRVAKAK